MYPKNINNYDLFEWLRIIFLKVSCVKTAMTPYFFETLHNYVPDSTRNLLEKLLFFTGRDEV